ncbi:hypothetical protein DXG01_009124 [Tephrocybe rancida]|nr:hypothetical protein DXG01_009124 [Tephrocybe rancida]
MVFFPSSQTLPNDTAIPFYAVTDPDKWNDKKFNVEQAMAFHDKGRQDETQSSSHKSSNSAGPIAGGVVGALAVILLGGGLAFFLYRKKQKWSKAAVGHVMDEGPGHARTVSDLSQKSNGIGYGYRQMERSFATSPSSQVPMSPTSGTMHTHNSSVNSLSYFGSVNHSVAPYAVASSPPPRGPSPLSTTSPTPVSHVGLNREDIIVPFTLPPSDEGVSGQGSHTNLVGGDRKRADGAIIPVYDSPNSLPSHIAQASSARNDSPSRARVNPPAYSAVDQQSVAPSRPHQMHSKKGSADTQYSVDSAASGGVTSVMPRHTSGGSISAIDDVIGQMGFGQGEESVSGSGGTLGTGQSRQFIRTQPFRPVLGNPDP